MSSPESNPRDYGWLEGWVLDEENLAGVLGLTVARIDSLGGFLDLVGAQPLSQTVRGVPALSKESPPGHGLIGVTQALDKAGQPIEGLVLAAECPGITSYDSAVKLSACGGEVLAFQYNLGQDWLKWAVDGVVRAEFSLWVGADTLYDGTEQGVAELIQRAGQTVLGPDSRVEDPCAAAATLMAEIFGVVITPKLLEEAAFDCGSVKIPR
jgi:hypothetical protein